MSRLSRTRSHVRWWASPIAALVTTAALASCGSLGRLTFDGNFERGLKPWTSTGGGAQCANYGTPSQNLRLRGNFYLDNVFVGQGKYSGRFDLPGSQLPTFPLQGCELTDVRTIGLGTDDYYGYMFYVPPAWTSGTASPASFWGITTAQFHFQNIWGSPIEFELHDNHMTLALETGACNNYLTSNPGCSWRSNADNPSGRPGNLGAHYAVPPPMQQDVWHEVIMHVHWASDSSGMIEVWHRVKGQTSWTRTVNLSGYPTVQWDASKGCCSTAVVDKIGAYRGVSSRPVSVWEDDFVVGTTFDVVAAALP